MIRRAHRTRIPVLLPAWSAIKFHWVSRAKFRRVSATKFPRVSTKFPRVSRTKFQRVLKPLLDGILSGLLAGGFPKYHKRLLMFWPHQRFRAFREGYST